MYYALLIQVCQVILVAEWYVVQGGGYYYVAKIQGQKEMGAEAPKFLLNCVRCVLQHDLVLLCCIAAPPCQIALDVQALCVQLAI